MSCKNVKAAATWMTILLTSTFVSGCGGGGGSTTTIDPKDQVIISEQTEILDDPETVASLEQVSTDGNILSFTGKTTQLDNLAPGEVFVLSPSEAAPEGLLRRAVEIESANGVTTVKSERAAITDAIKKGSLSASGALEPTASDVKVAAQSYGSGQSFSVLHKIEGVHLLQGQSAPVRTLAIEDPITFPFNVVLSDVELYDKDKNPETTDDRIVANGAIGFELDYAFDLDIDNAQIQRLKFSVTPTVVSKLQLSSSTAVEFSKSNTILSVRLPRLKFFIGLWPVWITPIIDVKVIGEGQAAVGLTSGATGKVTATSGVEYLIDRDDPWAPISERATEFETIPVEVAANASVTIAAGPALRFFVYDFAGPEASVEGYLTLAANLTSDPWWRLLGGVRAGAGVRAEVFSNELLSASFPDIIAYEIELAKAESGVLPIPEAPSNVTARAGDAANIIEWDNTAEASQYNLYWSTNPGVFPDSPGTEVIENVTSPYLHTGLFNDRNYYYVLKAKNAAGESQVSIEVSAKPHLPAADLSDGLVAYYPFNGSAQDESGNGHHGSVEGAIPTIDRKGFSNAAYEFDGNDDRITFSETEFDATFNNGDYTFNIWFQKEADSIGYENLFSHTRVAHDQRMSTSNNNELGWRTEYKSQRFWTEPHAFNDNEWVMATYVYDATARLLRMYINGFLLSENVADNWEPISHRYEIGDNSPSEFNRSWNGKLDDLRIYERALSTDEVLQLLEQ